MQNQVLSIGEVASIFGVSISTLRRWHKQKLLVPSFITPGHHRRYHLHKVAKYFGIGKKKRTKEKRITVAYSRVSSSDQREDLQRQENYLRSVLKKEKLAHMN